MDRRGYSTSCSGTAKRNNIVLYYDGYGDELGQGIAESCLESNFWVLTIHYEPFRNYHEDEVDFGYYGPIPLEDEREAIMRSFIVETSGNSSFNPFVLLSLTSE